MQVVVRFPGLIIGPFLDAYGSRAVGMFGASLCAVCYLTSAFLTSVWQLFVVFGLLAGKSFVPELIQSSNQENIKAS